MARILVVYGPNLNLLGEREPDVYGHETMEDISARLRDAATRDGVSLEVFHSNSEGAIIDRLHAARHEVDAVVLNAGALTHYSLALRDVLAPVCAGVITGFGTNSFLLGLRAAIDLVRR